MKAQLLDFLMCPECKGARLVVRDVREQNGRIAAGHLECEGCGRLYKIKEGIAVFSAGEVASREGGERGTDQKRKQMKHFDEECNEEFEIHRPHTCGRLYEFLLGWKFENAVRNLPFSIRGWTVLDVCCGSGMFSEFYARLGAQVVGVDISFEAARRAVRRGHIYGFEADFVIGDSQNLPFRDGSFNLVTVHDGLHHLEQPRAGLLEMCRVASEGIVVVEAADAALTRTAVAVGLSQKYEDAGNYVYRFAPRELSCWLTQAGYSVQNLERYIMYYPHEPGWVFRLFDSPVLFALGKWGFLGINTIAGKFGNKLQVIAAREGRSITS